MILSSNDLPLLNEKEEVEKEHPPGGISLLLYRYTPSEKYVKILRVLQDAARGVREPSIVCDLNDI